MGSWAAGLVFAPLPPPRPAPNPATDRAQRLRGEVLQGRPGIQDLRALRWDPLPREVERDRFLRTRHLGYRTGIG